MYAIYNNSIDAVNTLLEHGADIFMTDIDGMNILHIAAKENKLEILKVYKNSFYL